MEFKHQQTNLKFAGPIDVSKWKTLKSELVKSGLTPHEFNLLYYMLDSFGPVLLAWKKYHDSALCNEMLRAIMPRKGFFLTQVKSVGDTNHRALLECFSCLLLNIPFDFSVIMGYIEETEDGYKVK